MASTATRVWLHLAVLAVVANILPFFLFGWGQQQITSGLAGVFNGTSPLFTLAIAAVALPEERITRARGIGLLVGFLGVFLVVGPWDQNPLTSSIPGQLACLGAALCYAVSFVYTRRLLAGAGDLSDPGGGGHARRVHSGRAGHLEPVRGCGRGHRRRGGG